MFWRNKRKINFSWVSSDSRRSQKITLKRTFSGLEGTKVPYSRGEHFIKSFSLDWIGTVELLGYHFNAIAFSLLSQHFKFDILRLRKIWHLSVWLFMYMNRITIRKKRYFFTARFKELLWRWNVTNLDKNLTPFEVGL